MSHRTVHALTVGASFALVLGLSACSRAESSERPRETAELEAVESAPASEPAVDASRPAAAPEPAAEPARTVEPRPRPVPAPVVLAPAGTRLSLRLAEPVSTKSHRTGDGFEAVVVADVTGPDGSIAVPIGARVRGVVTESQKSPGSDRPAVLSVRFQSLELESGKRPIAATIVDADVEQDTRDSGGETAAKIAVGTAAGAVLGGVIGKDKEAALIGAGAGAVAGTAFAVATRDGHAEIGEGSTLTVSLDEPLTLR